MNTMGKILVILNFLFALVVGGFLIIDFGARQDWKRAFEQLQKESAVTRGSDQTIRTMSAELTNKLKQAQLDAEKWKQELLDLRASLEATEATLKTQIAELQTQKTGVENNLAVAVKEVGRLKSESQEFIKTIDERQNKVNELVKVAEDYRRQAVANQNNAETATNRVNALTIQIQELEEKMRQDAIAKRDILINREKNQANPPAVKVNGSVKKIDTVNPNLVMVSVGSDQGIEKGHTLDVYRTKPNPDYVGMIRILEAYQHESVGQLMPNALGIRKQMREGDLVSSKISSR